MDFTDNSVPAELQDFMSGLVDAIINPLMALIFGAAFVFFLWGLMVFILNQDNETKVQEGKQHMLWGVIGMLVMVSVFAIIEVVLATFGVSGTDLPETLPF